MRGAFLASVRAAISNDPVPDGDAGDTAKDRIYVERNGAEFQRASDAIQGKHGSRKSGMPMTGQTRRKSRKDSGNEAQMALDFGPSKLS